MADTRSSLIRRVRAPEDAASWQEFVALYRPLLLRYAWSHGLAGADADDAVQEVFAVLVRELPRFDLDHARGRFRTWLWQITRNTIVDGRRRQDRQARAELPWRENAADRESKSAEVELDTARNSHPGRRAI